MEAARKIIKNEIKHHTYGPIITSFIVYLLIFVLFGLVELKKDIVIMIVERFLPLMGIILISPCFQYEMDYGIEDVIRSKSTGILTTYLIRLILRIFIYGMLTFLFIALIKITDSQVEMALYFFQSFSLGLLLVSLGFFAFGNSSNLIVVYIVPILYYLLNWMPNWKVLGDFYLFRLRYGLEPKIGLNIFIAIIFLTVGLYANRK